MTAHVQPPRRRRRSRRAPASAPHVETFVNTRTGDPIYIACSCLIGRHHDYAQWQEATSVRLGTRAGRATTSGAA
jgi:hypothetical protein